MAEIRILTFNTLFRGDVRARLTALGTVLEQSDYDVVCLQELWIPTSYALVRKLTPSYPHVAHAARLPLVSGGLVILSRLPLTDVRFTRYRWHGRLRREMVTRKGVLSARVPWGDGSLSIVNSHLSANKAGSWKREIPFTAVLQAELQELAAEVVRVGNGRPTIAVGDFNVPRDSWLLEEFTSASGLADAFNGSTETTYRSWSGGSLDQVLASPDVRVDTKVVLKDAVPLTTGREVFLSDHFGVEAFLSA